MRDTMLAGSAIIPSMVMMTAVARAAHPGGGPGTVMVAPGLSIETVEQARRFEAWEQALSATTGRFGVVRDEPMDLPGHTVFRPARRSGRAGTFPIVGFADGGCRTTPIQFTAFPAEIAAGCDRRRPRRSSTVRRTERGG